MSLGGRMLIGPASGPFRVTSEFRGHRTRHQQRGIALSPQGYLVCSSRSYEEISATSTTSLLGFMTITIDTTNSPNVRYYQRHSRDRMHFMGPTVVCFLIFAFTWSYRKSLRKICGD